jgi:uncharacterized protein
MENRNNSGKRGFASMEPSKQREIASKGGHSQGKQNNPGNFANNTDKAREAGRKGGQISGGNFRNNPQRASEAGRKGGESRRNVNNQNRSGTSGTDSNSGETGRSDE